MHCYELITKVKILPNIHLIEWSYADSLKALRAGKIVSKLEGCRMVILG